ncbi:triosephosphate isomerase [Geotalea uraniireducens]|uniref:Triosephosphate isomerase n=1 Tax=Geotalea uraniireducens TaxID=351604 RepID=A0ABN6VUQ1_9BACT|nr:triose-phosphate isomerase [Geotalea uraniireducens]BDV43207.1 triosephosphate isomerase [Geotalea uraniireducens]
MRKPVIAGNWKLFKKTAETADLVNKLVPLVKNNRQVDIIIAPVFTVLSAAKQALSGSAIHLAAQDCYWQEEGAFTGEVSPGMLVDVGCSHVIVGHSERRQYFGETDQAVNCKIKAAVAAGLVVLFCIGETLAEREAGRTFEVLRTQLSGGTAGLTTTELEKIIIAYEPVWAIGTGKTASNEQAQEAHAFIRSEIAGLFGNGPADMVRILYGGSVKPENIKGLMAQKDIDGALVGGASLQADSFAAIANYDI